MTRGGRIELQRGAERLVIDRVGRSPEGVFVAFRDGRPVAMAPSAPEAMRKLLASGGAAGAVVHRRS